ncbi:MAG TPA: GNAT family N-acetyltransferase [Solirubrobacterales bacterium]|nr:GNAT family N-acetyltransferase [Solirubrobacterales bacterium]
MSAETGEITIAYGGRERIDDVKELWLRLVEHHSRVSGRLGEVRPPDESWNLRRANYRLWLEEEDAFLCIAESDGAPIGYAMVHMRDGDNTFASEERIALVETICVLPDRRGLGAGAAIVEGMRAKGHELNVHEARATHLVGNEIAGEFFKALGGEPVAIMYSVPIESTSKSGRRAT